MRNAKKKGQIFSYDAVIAAGILLSMFTLIIGYMWGMDVLMETERRTLENDAREISDQLLKPGVWEDMSFLGIKVVGITKNATTRELDPEKIRVLSQFRPPSSSPHSSDSDLFSKMNARAYVFVNITNVTTGYPYGGFGYVPSEADSPRIRVVSRRIALINETAVGNTKVPAFVTVVLWRK